MSPDDDVPADVLDAWSPLAPPAGFADRVLAAPAPVAKRRVPLVLGATAAVLAAAAVAVAVLVSRPADRSASGTVTASARHTALLGDRGVAVAEAEASLSWTIDARGAAVIEQRTGNVFYRVEHGEPFVVHTPAGDVRVTGTCFRVEVEAMKPTHKMILSGAAGAAIATAVLITVYEGHVVADTSSGHAELAAGTHATMGPDGTFTTGSGTTTVAAVDAPFDIARATRDDLVARASLQQDEIVRLKTRLAKLEHEPSTGAGERSNAAEPGHLWHEPSAETLADWATNCHIRYDSPDVDGFSPLRKAEDSKSLGLEAGELDGYNTSMAEVAKRWQTLVRQLYLEATGDATGAETLSIEAMRNEIREKSPPDEMGMILEKLARERAGLQAPPADLAKTPPLERLMRALVHVGDDAETTLAKRLGDKRAHEIRGDGWSSRSDMSGCNP